MTGLAENGTQTSPGERLIRIEMLRRQIDAELEAEIAELKAENAELRARLEADRLNAEAQPADVPQAEPPMQEEWLTPKDVAKRLGVGVGTVYWYMRQGEPVCWPLYDMTATKRQTKPSDLEAWIEKRRRMRSEAVTLRGGKSGGQKKVNKRLGGRAVF